MKRSTIFLTLLASALVAGCTKSDDLAGNNPNQKDRAYLQLSISTPGTRANADPEAGTEAESTVEKVKILIFDKDYNYIGLGERSGANATNTFEFEVAPDAYRFFAIVNPTADIEAVLSKISGNWTSIESSLQTVLQLTSKADLDKYKSANSFTMVNAGSYDGNREVVLAHPLDATLVNNKLSTDKEHPTKITIPVDRLVAKFTADLSPSFKVSDDRTVAGVDQPDLIGIIEGVRLNVTNKKSYIYSHIKQVNDLGDDYRGDPNMTVPTDVEQMKDNFFWLHNYENPTFNAVTKDAAYSEYVFENTATGEFFNYNNLTQLVVKATYRPTGQRDPETLPDNYTTILNHVKEDANSWFAVNVEGQGTLQMTFKGLIKYYSASPTTDATRAKMDIQLQHLLSFLPTASIPAGYDITKAKWSDAQVTCQLLNMIPNGGYRAATVEDEANYIVQFYQNGLNYYDIFIQHDEKQDIGHLGRWGMVRNNHYKLTIKSLSGAGLPYIPDPTDPDIKDPQNPNPNDPEPADKGMAYIEASISVNPWTIWKQDVDLNE